jgi:hypothetical protein
VIEATAFLLEQGETMAVLEAVTITDTAFTSRKTVATWNNSIGGSTTGAEVKVSGTSGAWLVVYSDGASLHAVSPSGPIAGSDTPISSTPWILEGSTFFYTDRTSGKIMGRARGAGGTFGPLVDTGFTGRAVGTIAINGDGSALGYTDLPTPATSFPLKGGPQTIFTVPAAINDVLVDSLDLYYPVAGTPFEIRHFNSAAVGESSLVGLAPGHAMPSLLRKSLDVFTWREGNDEVWSHIAPIVNRVFKATPPGAPSTAAYAVSAPYIWNSGGIPRLVTTFSPCDTVELVCPPATLVTKEIPRPQ